MGFSQIGSRLARADWASLGNLLDFTGLAHGSWASQVWARPGIDRASPCLHQSHGAHGCPYESRLRSEWVRYLGCMTEVIKTLLLLVSFSKTVTRQGNIFRRNTYISNEGDISIFFFSIFNKGSIFSSFTIFPFFLIFSISSIFFQKIVKIEMLAKLSKICCSLPITE